MEIGEPNGNLSPHSILDLSPLSVFLFERFHLSAVGKGGGASGAATGLRSARLGIFSVSSGENERVTASDGSISGRTNAFGSVNVSPPTQGEKVGDDGRHQPGNTHRRLFFFLVLFFSSLKAKSAPMRIRHHTGVRPRPER